MKNPFVKEEDHSALIAGIIIGSVAAGTAAYLIFTEKGADLRKEISSQFSKFRDRLMGTVPEVKEDHANDYMHHPMKQPKTDRDALLHHEIIHE